MAARLIRCGTARFVEVDELISVGTQALLESAARFDPDAGAQFSTFAFPRIRGAMIDAVARLAPLPRSAFRASRARMADGKQGLFVASLDALCMRGKEPIADAPDPAIALDAQHWGSRVNAALARLPANKRRFIEGHYFDGIDLQSIGRELGLSKSWASRLHAQALAELRAALAAGDPKAAR